MHPLSLPPEGPNGHIGAIVYVEFGHALGLPRLYLKARIVAEKVHGNTTYFLVEVLDTQVQKWISEHAIQGYDWEQPTIVKGTLSKRE